MRKCRVCRAVLHWDGHCIKCESKNWSLAIGIAAGIALALIACTLMIVGCATFAPKKEVSQGAHFEALMERVTAQTVELANQVKNVNNEVWPWAVALVCLVVVGGGVVTMLGRHWIKSHSYEVQKPRYMKEQRGAD